MVSVLFAKICDACLNDHPKKEVLNILTELHSHIELIKLIPVTCWIMLICHWNNYNNYIKNVLDILLTNTEFDIILELFKTGNHHVSFWVLNYRYKYHLEDTRNACTNLLHHLKDCPNVTNTINMLKIYSTSMYPCIISSFNHVITLINTGQFDVAVVLIHGLKGLAYGSDEIVKKIYSTAVASTNILVISKIILTFTKDCDPNYYSTIARICFKLNNVAYFNNVIQSNDLAMSYLGRDAINDEIFSTGSFNQPYLNFLYENNMKLFSNDHILTYIDTTVSFGKMEMTRWLLCKISNKIAAAPKLIKSHVKLHEERFYYAREISKMIADIIPEYTIKNGWLMCNHRVGDADNYFNSAGRTVSFWNISPSQKQIYAQKKYLIGTRFTTVKKIRICEKKA